MFAHSLLESVETICSNKPKIIIDQIEADQVTGAIAKIPKKH